MPMNRYKCEKCQNEYQHLGPYADRPCPECHHRNKPLLPRALETPSTTETVDKHLGVKQRTDLQERAKRRSINHSKIDAKEIARENCETYEQHGINEDDPKMI